jgi:predicted NBD/HSP70 family sugar kinase
VGVAVAGYFIGDGTRLNTSPELDDWALVEFRTRMAARLGRPVEIENVARAAAVGEAILGVGRWAPSFAYLNIAAGLGCGIIVDGELMRGRWGNAGEIGALPERLGAIKPTLERLCEILAENGVATDGIGDMLAAYQAGWPGLDQWIAEAAPALSTLVLILHYTLDLDAVVIGGRLPPDLAQRLVEAITWLDDDRPARRGKPLPRPRIVAAELTAQSAAIGAASVPLKRLFFSPPASTEAA